MSNPDLLRDNSTTVGQGPAVESDQRTEYPEHVFKVYKSDQVPKSFNLYPVKTDCKNGKPLETLFTWTNGLNKD